MARVVDKISEGIKMAFFATKKSICLVSREAASGQKHDLVLVSAYLRAQR
jgi:hypothetical protein